MKKALIIGYGYTGWAIDRELATAGYTIHGVRRSWSEPEKDSFSATQIEADIEDPYSLRSLDSSYDLVVNCVSAGSRGNPQRYRRVYQAGAENLVKWASKRNIGLLIYTGSTSVYGHESGEWVDETSATNPKNPTGEILLNAENIYLRADGRNTVPSIVLRLTGIYGPDRIRSVKRFKNGKVELYRSGNKYKNMIHRTDIARAIQTIANRVLEKNYKTGVRYNLTDSYPVREKEFYEWLSQRFDKQMPPIHSKEKRRTNKRVSNDKFLETFNFNLKHPSFRSGMKPLINSVAPSQ